MPELECLECGHTWQYPRAGAEGSVKCICTMCGSWGFRLVARPVAADCPEAQARKAAEPAGECSGPERRASSSPSGS